MVGRLDQNLTKILLVDAMENGLNKRTEITTHVAFNEPIYAQLKAVFVFLLEDPIPQPKRNLLSLPPSLRPKRNLSPRSQEIQFSKMRIQIQIS